MVQGARIVPPATAGEKSTASILMFARAKMRAQNKLVLALVIGALFLVGIACTRGTEPSGAPVSATAEPGKKELSPFSQVTGTQILVSGVYQGDDRSGLDFSLSSGREYSYYVYNYVFFDMASEQFQTLLPTNESIILNKVGLPSLDSTTVPVKWWLYSVVKTDSNQDKKLSDQDKFILAMSDVDGKNYVELIPDIDQLLGQFMKSDTLLFFFYKQNDKKYYAKIDLQARSVVSTAEYPSFGADVK
jgi:hypothetical protein